jgi:hypothetical protein
MMSKPKKLEEEEEEDLNLPPPNHNYWTLCVIGLAECLHDLSKFPQDVTFSPNGSFSPPFDTFCFYSCVCHTTFLIDTNRTKF